MRKLIKRQILRFLIVGIIFVPTIFILGQNDTPVTIHVVQRGENLFRIALKYDLTVDDMVDANGLIDPSNIQVGQRLIVPIGGVPQRPTEPTVHIVQVGETLSSIAEYYQVPMDKLAALNNITPSSIIYAGQSLIISPSGDYEFEPVVIPHVVQAGETLYGIALEYETTIHEILSMNDDLELTSTIYAGQSINVPAISPDLALDLPALVASLEVAPVFFIEGQTGSVKLTTSSPATVSGTFMGNNLVIASLEGLSSTILIPIPMFIEPNVYPLVLNIIANDGRVADIVAHIRVVAGVYEIEDVAIDDELADLLNPSVESNELLIISNLTSTFNPERYFDGPMSLPAATIMNSPYGSRRSYNGGSVDRYHNGADFASAAGTNVMAAASGRVVLADTLHIRGVSIVIDHGWGVYTNYSHLSERSVALGDFVTTGQIIGLAGETGRVTGAHLHWELWLHGIAVDPMQWVSQNFSD